MPDIKISELPEVGSLVSNDITPFVASGITSKIRLSNLANTMPNVPSATSASYSSTSSYSNFANTSSVSSRILGGVQNYIPIWYTSTTLDSSQIYQLFNNIIIGGTTNPDNYKLYVLGSGKFTSGLNITGSVKINNLSETIQTNIVGYNNNTGQLYYQNTGSFTASYSVSSSNAQTASYSVSSSNAQTASYVLNAVSASYASTSSNILGGTNNFVTKWINNTSLGSSIMYDDGTNIGIGITSPRADLHIVGRLINGGVSGEDENIISATGEYSHAEGFATTAQGNYSHAEGEASYAVGIFSHAEGGSTNALGNFSHAEGIGTSAIGFTSHAEGFSTTARGDYSHAEGIETIASGSASHAEGDNTIAKGYASHVEGIGTVANGPYQHVQGQYNIPSTISSAFIIGNGSNDGYRGNLVFAVNNSFQITGSLSVSGMQNISQPNFVAYNTNTGQLTYASTSSFTAATASFVTASNVYGPFGSNSILSASYSVSSSNAQTASYVLNAVSSSYASTSSNILGGTNGYIPLWSGSSELTISNIYQSASSIGIGITSPQNGFLLDVNGQTVIRSLLYVQTGITSLGGGGGFTINDNGISKINGGPLLINRTSEYQPGIIPASKLTVDGKILALEGIQIAGNDSPVPVISAFRTDNTQYGTLVYNGWGDFAFNKSLLIGYTPRSSGYGEGYLYVLNSIGINKTGSNASLDVNGNVIITGSLSITNLSNISQPNFVAYNTNTGQLTYVSTSSFTAANAVSASYAITSSFSNNFKATNLSLGTNPINVITGYGNYISTVTYPTATEASSFWIKIISIDSSPQRIKLFIQAESDNTIAYDEFEIATSGYGMPHNILRKPTTIYNESKIVGILTSNPSDAIQEVWINVLGTADPNSYLPFIFIYSNVNLLSLADMQASRTTTKPTKANGGTELIINNNKRTKYTIQTSAGAEFNNEVFVSGSVIANSFTGSLFGTASYANNAVTTSYALTASIATTSSYATTASYVVTAQTASYVLNAVSSSYATTASYSVSSSNAQTASYVNPLSQSVYISGSIYQNGYFDNIFNGNINAPYIIANNDFYGDNVRVNGIRPNSLTYIPFYSNESPFGEIMRVQNDGSVLIGTTTPNGYKLQVNGSGHFSGSLSITNLSNISQPNFVAYNTNTGQLTYASTSSFTAATASFVTASNVYGPFGSNSILSASYSVSSSNATTASYVLNAVSASYATTASYSVSSSNAQTASNILGGTNNFVTKWTNNTSLGSSLIYDNGTNIGIGTTSPDSLLSLEKANINNVSLFKIKAHDGPTPETVFDTIFKNNAAITTISYYGGNQSKIVLDGGTENAGGNILLCSGSGEVTARLHGTFQSWISSGSGNFGVGTNNPLYKLDVSGSTRIVGSLSVGSNENEIPYYINGIYAVDGLSQFKQINVANGSITFNEGTAGIGGYSSSPGGVLTDYITINTNSIERIRVLTNGNVGIGTSTPAYKLDILGSLRASNDILFPGINNISKSNIIGYDSTNGQLYYQTTSSLLPDTASYSITSSLALKNIVTASADSSYIYFTKGDGTTFNISFPTVGTATNADTASFVTASNVWGPFGRNSIVSASYVNTAQTASYVLNSVSSSYASSSLSSSYALTASYILGSGGTTPTLQQVTNQGSSTTVLTNFNSGLIISSSLKVTGSLNISASVSMYSSSLINTTNEVNILSYNTSSGKLGYQSIASLGVDYGTYIPEPNSLTNISTLVVKRANYMGIFGGAYTVSGIFYITPTNQNTETSFLMTTPTNDVMGDFEAEEQAAGTAYFHSASVQSGLRIYADENKCVKVSYYNTTAQTLLTCSFIYTYYYYLP